MKAPITITEAACTAILCLYAVGTSRGADPLQHGVDKTYEAAVARASLLYRAAQDMCEKEEGSKRDVCFKEAKATHLRAVSDAKARLKAAQMVSDQRRDPAPVSVEGER
jgi:hypothetical protein